VRLFGEFLNVERIDHAMHGYEDICLIVSAINPLTHSNQLEVGLSAAQ